MPSPSDHKLCGLWAPLLPAFGADGEIDRDTTEADLERLLDAGMDGIDDGGARNESAELRPEERDWLAERVVAACARAGRPSILGVGEADPRAATERIRRLSELAPTSIGFVLPSGVEPGTPEFLEVIESYARAAGSSELVLDHPPHPRLEFPPELCEQMLERVPQVIGLRVGLGSPDWYERWHESSADLSLFVPGHHYATGIERGASGSCSAFALLSPTGARDLRRLCESSIETALEREAELQFFLIQHLLPLQIEEGYCCDALDRALAAAGDFVGGSARLREPRAWVDDERVAMLREAARQELPWFFEDADSASDQDRAA